MTINYRDCKKNGSTNYWNCVGYFQSLNSLNGKFTRILFCSFHVGSNSRDEHSFANGINIASQLFSMAKQYGHNLSVLDIGGKF